MAKRLVICCDGTWDRQRERHGGVATCTNVAKLREGLADRDDAGEPQLVHYEEGVGTDPGPVDHLLGGIFGIGVAGNVRDSYRFVVEHYEPGDALYFFGFSRGAYTARSAVGMIRNSGILRGDERGRLDEAWRLYRDRGNPPASARAEAFRRAHCHPDAPIDFVGVWDTVGSLGAPFALPLWRRWWAFHDTELSSHVRNAFHALAVDEHRVPFKPTLWTRREAVPGQRLEQVWFTGCHRDAGGGNVDPDLADIALRWMVERAVECGLRFDPGHFKLVPPPIDPQSRLHARAIDPNPLGPLHDSSVGIWRLASWGRRAVPWPGVEHSEQLLARSVVERIDAIDYAPRGLGAARPPVTPV